jgi:L-lysine 2,3-aminomutase
MYATNFQPPVAGVLGQLVLVPKPIFKGQIMTRTTIDLQDSTRFRSLGPRQIDEIVRRFPLSEEAQKTIRSVSLVLPFRVNEYVLTELIDWARVPNDPVYQLVFPQPGMLALEHERRLLAMAGSGDNTTELSRLVQDIRSRMNPHPSGQKEFNVPRVNGDEVQGIQHKYRETVLYFPAQGQTCHAYCAYCFRWAQFVGDSDLRFAAPNPSGLVEYLRQHSEVSDVLVTGGDPMIMSSDRLRAHMLPVLDISTVDTIRIGTKSVAYWPHRFVTDRDADDVLRLFESIVMSGRHLAVMAHYSHPRELQTAIARKAIQRIRSTGAMVYCQSPMIAHVNDDQATLNELWRTELSLGMVPYYLFVERDTGPQDYYKVPLAENLRIFTAAYQALPGLSRTVRGPVMSATPGKVAVDGVVESEGGRFFQLRMLQARDPKLVGRPFRAHYSETACWLDDLELDSTGPVDILSSIDGLRRVDA